MSNIVNFKKIDSVDEAISIAAAEGLKQIVIVGTDNDGIIHTVASNYTELELLGAISLARWFIENKYD